MRIIVLNINRYLYQLASTALILQFLMKGMVIYVTNVFKKLIKKELGDVNYQRYFTFAKNNLNNRISDSRAIYNDMYEKLKYKDIKAITMMHDRLNDTLLLALRISKNYMLALMFYLFSSIYLIFKDLHPELTLISLTLMSVCFVYKTYEFVVNKFCYVDAHIALVYKAVLDRIILGNSKNNKLYK